MCTGTKTHSETVKKTVPTKVAGLDQAGVPVVFHFSFPEIAALFLLGCKLPH